MSDMYFKGLPDKSTPLIPSNLDKLNDIKVSPTEPTTNEKVWIQKGKNLLDLKKWNFESCILNGDGTITSNIINNYYCRIFTDYLNDFLFKNKGKTITFSTGTPLNNKTTSIIINGTRTSGFTYQEEGEANSGKASITIAEDFTSIANIELRFNRESSPFTDTTTIISNLQLEQGSTATEYEEYIEEKVWVKNDNGVYVPFVPENKPINITTGVEFETGRIIDGKVEYGKRIDCGYLPGAGETKEIAHGLTNFTVTDLQGNAFSSAYTSSIPLPYHNTNDIGYSVSLDMGNTHIYLKSALGQNHYYGYVTIYYTKN